MRKAINEKAWDGQWYIRATCKEGNIGSKESQGSKIYLNAQTWAVLAEVPSEDRLPIVLEAIDNM